VVRRRRISKTPLRITFSLPRKMAEFPPFLLSAPSSRGTTSRILVYMQDSVTVLPLEEMDLHLGVKFHFPQSSAQVVGMVEQKDKNSIVALVNSKWK
jgi:hypothetical protein